MGRKYVPAAIRVAFRRMNALVTFLIFVTCVKCVHFVNSIIYLGSNDEKQDSKPRWTPATRLFFLYTTEPHPYLHQNSGSVTANTIICHNRKHLHYQVHHYGCHSRIPIYVHIRLKQLNDRMRKGSCSRIQTWKSGKSAKALSTNTWGWRCWRAWPPLSPPSSSCSRMRFARCGGLIKPRYQEIVGEFEC